MEKVEIRICPECGKEYTDWPSISFKDNKTEICPDCWEKEANEHLIPIVSYLNHEE